MKPLLDLCTFYTFSRVVFDSYSFRRWCSSSTLCRARIKLVVIIRIHIILRRSSCPYTCWRKQPSLVKDQSAHHQSTALLLKYQSPELITQCSKGHSLPYRPRLLDYVLKSRPCVVLTMYGSYQYTLPEARFHTHFVWSGVGQGCLAIAKCGRIR